MHTYKVPVQSTRVHALSNEPHTHSSMRQTAQVNMQMHLALHMQPLRFAFTLCMRRLQSAMLVCHADGAQDGAMAACMASSRTLSTKHVVIGAARAEHRQGAGAYGM